MKKGRMLKYMMLTLTMTLTTIGASATVFADEVVATDVVTETEAVVETEAVKGTEIDIDTKYMVETYEDDSYTYYVYEYSPTEEELEEIMLKVKAGIPQNGPASWTKRVKKETVTVMETSEFAAVDELSETYETDEPDLQQEEVQEELLQSVYDEHYDYETDSDQNVDLYSEKLQQIKEAGHNLGDKIAD